MRACLADAEPIVAGFDVAPAGIEVIERAVAARADYDFWIDDLGQQVELVDPVGALSSWALPAGSVLWAMHPDMSFEPCAELTASGWCSAGTARQRWDTLSRRHAWLGRFWQVDASDPLFETLVELGPPGDVRIVGDTAFARLQPPTGVDDLEADVDAAGDWLVQRHGVRRVVWSTGAGAAVDLCPDGVSRAAQAAARAAAQDLGEAAGRGVSVSGDGWRAADGGALRAAARHDPLLARALDVHFGRHRKRLRRLPMRGPNPSPALPAPVAFVGAWTELDALVCDRAKAPRERAGVGGRPRALSLARYVRARRAVEAAGEAPTDLAIRRQLAAEGMKVARTTVLSRRRMYDAGLLDALPDELRETGLDAIAATAVPARRGRPKQPAQGGKQQGKKSQRVVWPWMGGKDRILRFVVDALPKGRFPYVETCAGGLAVMLHLLEQGRVERPVGADADADVIETWRWIQRDPDRVYSIASALPWTAEAYDELCADFQSLDGVHRAAAFFYIMWRSHNGLCRRNQEGRFNMPPGDRPRIGIERDRLRHISKALRPVRFVHRDAEALIDELRGDEVAYCDPPYWPTTKTAGFSAYDGRGFQAGDLARIVAAGRRHAARGGVFVLSNASSAPVLELCADAEVRWVSAWRSMSCTNTRGGAHEILARWG